MLTVMNKLPVLLTSSVVPADADVKLVEPEQRLFHTIESIAQWLRFSNFVQLVICDGSGFDFTDVLKQKFPDADIECLAFQNDKEQVARRGKGYGEGEIVKFAIENSERIRESGFFAKCTGKLWVENFEACWSEWNGRFLGKAHFDNVFSLRATRLSYFDTRFYLADVAFYQQYFSHVHLDVGGAKGLSLEDCFKTVVVGNQMKNFLFRTPPLICGVGGGSGRYYKNNQIRRLKDRLRAWCVINNPGFASLFSEASFSSGNTARN
jgi:hypothetical protein